MWYHIVLSIYLILFNAITVHAQQGATDIEIVSNAPDIVGQRLVYEIKEQFRKSTGFNLVDPIGSRWQLVIITLDQDTSKPNQGTVYSIVWNMVLEDLCGPSPTALYGESTVGYCGTYVVESSAQAIVARTDNLVSSVRNMIRNAGN
jgi:hypothetical protein